MDYSNINYLAIITAGLASWVLGALWYSPLLFGKLWQQEMGMTEEDLKGANMPLIFGTSCALMMVMSFGMAVLIQGHSTPLGCADGLIHGLIIGGFFVSTSMGINYLYQRKTLKLWFIDAAYQVVFLTMAGGILGAWK